MHIVITGGCGNLGSHVCRELVEAGHEVLAVDVAYRKDMPCPVQVADLLNREHCYAWLTGADALVHLGNHPSFHGMPPARGYMENVTMTANVLQASSELGVKKIIYASSVQVMGDFPDPLITSRANKPALPLNGLEPHQPENLYALSKTAGEQMLAYYADRFGMETVALRFPSLYKKEFPPRPAWSQQKAHGWLLLCHSDAARLVSACISTSLPGFRSYLPAQRENVFKLEIAQLLDEQAREYPLRLPREEIREMVDTSRITDETGWRPAPGIFRAD